MGEPLFNKIECSKYVIDLLKAINVALIHTKVKEFESPFSVSVNTFKNDVFEVKGYNEEDLEQNYNFKYKDIEISWYKYLGRDTTINREVKVKEAVEMTVNCIISLYLEGEE